jgi:hypothetical protein
VKLESPDQEQRASRVIAKFEELMPNYLADFIPDPSSYTNFAKVVWLYPYARDPGRPVLRQALTEALKFARQSATLQWTK